MAQQEIIWLITFESGETQEEYGSSVQDVREFIARSFHHKGPVRSTVPLHGDDGSEV